MLTGPSPRPRPAHPKPAHPKPAKPKPAKPATPINLHNPCDHYTAHTQKLIPEKFVTYYVPNFESPSPFKS